MPTKSKKTKAALSEKHSAETPAEAPRQPVVTQIVEVVEVEEAPKVDEPVSESPAIADPPVPASTEANVPVSDESDIEVTDEPEKKELVEELFRGSESAAMPEITEHRRQTSRVVVLWSIVMLVTAVTIGGGLLFFAKGSSFPAVGGLFVQPTPTPVPTSTPVPTPTLPPVIRADLKIQVLNGGGISGAATKMKKLLEAKGYKVTGTGNTPEYSFDKTEIVVKPGREAAIELIKSDLTDYIVGDTTSTLDADADYDAQVIVGKQ